MDRVAYQCPRAHYRLLRGGISTGLFVYAIIVSEFSRAAEANNNETPMVSTSVMATVLRACRACEANSAVSGGMVHQDREHGSGYISC